MAPDPKQSRALLYENRTLKSLFPVDAVMQCDGTRVRSHSAIVIIDWVELRRRALLSQILDTRARALEKQVASRDEQIKGFQRDVRRNENATKVLVREKELLACKLTETQVHFEEEKKTREAAWETRLGELSGRLAETTEILEKARGELEEVKRAAQEREELERREREALVKVKGESVAETERLKERVRVLEEELDKRQEELKVRGRFSLLEALLLTILR